jgi:hypothetical protein
MYENTLRGAEGECSPEVDLFDGERNAGRILRAISRPGCTTLRFAKCGGYEPYNRSTLYPGTGGKGRNP